MKRGTKTSKPLKPFNPAEADDVHAGGSYVIKNGKPVLDEQSVTQPALRKSQRAKLKKESK